MIGGNSANSAQPNTLKRRDVKVLSPSGGATTQIDTETGYVLVNSPAATSYLALPDPSERLGEILTVRALDNGVGEVGVYQFDGSTDAIGDNLSTTGDYAAWVSDGGTWILIADKTT